MSILILFIGIIAISALSVPFGADSRQLTDHALERDSLWSR